MRRLVGMGAVIAFGCVLTSVAHAEEARYGGTATDGTRVTLQTTASGKPRLLRFGDYEAPCTRGKPPLKDPIGGFIPPFDKSSERLLDDHGRGRGKTDDGRRVSIKWDLDARHTEDDLWVGGYETRWTYARRGHVQKKCSTSFDFELARKP